MKQSRYFTCKRFFAAGLLYSLLACGVALGGSASDFAPVLGDAGKIQNVDQYWITFSGDSDKDATFMMQIDANGSIIRPPKAIYQSGRFGQETGATALGKNGQPNRLNLWHWGKHNILYRGVLNTVTMVPVGLKKLTIASTDDDTLQVTQKPSGNFLLVEVPGRQIKAFPVAPTGLPSSPSYFLAPKATRSNDEASISADGRIVITNRNSPDVPLPPDDQIYLQQLDATGKPSGTPKLLATFKDIEASDVTNALTGNKRFVVYIVDKGSAPPDNRLFLQVVGPSGEKVGAAVLLNIPPTRDQDDQNVAIDPLGRFVVFTIGGNNVGCAGHDILVYQGLTALGKKRGPLKVIAGCTFVPGDIVNIDILKN